MPSGPPFAFLPHRADAGGGPERVGAAHPGPRRSSSSTLGSGQLSGRCPEAPSPPPTSSRIGCRGLVGGPRARIKLRVARAACVGFQSLGAKARRALAAARAEFTVRSPNPSALSSFPATPGSGPFGGGGSRAGPRGLARVRAGSAR